MRGNTVVHNIRRAIAAHKAAIAIVMIAVIVRVAVFQLALWREQIEPGAPLVPAPYTDYVAEPGPIEYIMLARNIAENGVFSVSPEAPFFPDAYRTPGYPIFIVPFLIFGTLMPYMLIVANIILAALSGLLVFAIGKQLFARSTIPFLAALAFVVEPVGATRLTMLIFPDVLFTFLMLLSLYTIVRFSEMRNIFVSGLLLGSAILVKPIAQFLPLLFLAVLAVAQRASLRAFLLKTAPVFLCGAALLVIPWSLRNFSHFHTFQLASIGHYTFYITNVPYYYAHKEQRSAFSVSEEFFERLPKKENHIRQRSFAYSDILLAPFFSVLREDFWGYARFHAQQTAKFFLTDGLRDAARWMGGGVLDNSGVYFGTLAAQRKFGDIGRALARPDPSNLLFLAGTLFWSFVFFFTLVSFVVGVRRRQYLLIIFFIFALYFAVLTAPDVNARYRYPVSPFLFFLAAYGLSYFANPRVVQP